MTQAEQPVQRPDVTTSVNSSAHCGFSGGMGPPYSADGPVGPDTVRRCPRSSKSSCYRSLAEKALGRPIARVWMVDSRYGRGGTTPRRLRARWWASSFTAARRRGKLMLLDTDGGPTLGVRFGMTGRARGRRPARRWTGCATGRACSTRSGCGPVSPSRTGASSAARPTPVRLARAGARRGPARARRARRVTGRAAPAVAVGSGRAAGRRHRSRRGSWTRSGWPASGNLLADEILWRAGLDPGAAHAARRRRAARAAHGAARRRCASSAGGAARTWAS